MSLTQQASRVTPLAQNRTAKVSKRPSGLPKQRAQPVRVVPAPAAPATADSPQDAWEYGLDVWQRTVLFWDALRQRADNMLEHERAGLPPLLDFKYETILDARRFEHPANYALLRITEVGEDCWEDCVDPTKPPVIVVDPRAGHGPGIGGFKHDSEVGMALHEGHPVYFVIFFPQPMPGQTLADVHHALRRFEHPANYALLRITAVGEDCWEDCVDPDKPPVIVVDPRAGHGPGIGGFKHDSEVGMALHEGYPVYFVIFFPQPMPGQTLADVHHALRRFVAEVAERHPGKPPILYGNCQAGWAVTLLAADCQGLTGPTVLNGSPLSYWAGESGTNPMRVSGGLLGGAWLAHFMSDLGDGRFDGAWLAQNFENLKPEKAIWGKYAGLFNKIDTERERFLEFERWWNGFYTLSREEILAIVENLFIGNKLEQGEFRICDGCVADLRRIRNPIVIFASYGDNITPPHQALGWIPVVYKDTDDLKRAGQRIVYLTNPHVGHLGIFVSAGVARLEHRAILESLEDIEALAPGLYEMKIDNPSGDPDCHKSQYAVHFEERRVEDLHIPRENGAFERVRAASEFNESLYRAFVSPWVQAATNPWVAESLKWLHPMRTSRYMFSEAFNPWMGGVATMAEAVAKERTPLAQDHPMMARERELIDQVTDAMETAREARDSAYEQVFNLMYGEASALGAGTTGNS